MARFFGRVGFGESQDTDKPGVFEDVIVEREYYGTVAFNLTRFVEAEKLNKDLGVSNTIEIVPDAYANDHFFAIRYVEWTGVLWTVDSVELRSPRLLLRIGEVYNGPTAAAP